MNISEALLTGAVDIEFTKANGDVRYMKCTRCLNLIPSEYHPIVKESTDTVDDDDPDLVKVFDLDINEWRSFRESRLISWCPETLSLDLE